MKAIHYFNIFAIATLFLFSSCSESIDAVPSKPCDLKNDAHPHAYRYQKIVDEFLDAGSPGVSVTVISPEGTWISSGGKADLGNNVGLSPCHTLRVGSITKVFTAAAIMRLQDKGVLNVKDKINKYIPGRITKEIENANLVTIEQLLNHHSGIKDYLGIGSILDILNYSVKKRSAEENLKIIYGKKADFAPGKGMQYSNSNYLLLGMIMKYATGKSAYQVMKDEIFDPLNLNNTYPGNEIPSDLSRGYYDVYDNGFVQDLTEIDNNAIGGEDMLDGGVISNSYDVAVFLNALLKGELVTKASLNQMQEFLPITQDMGDMDFIKDYGFGLMRLETPSGKAIGHYGNVYCFNALVCHFPEQDVTISVLQNGGSAKIIDTLFDEHLFEHLFDE